MPTLVPRFKIVGDHWFPKLSPSGAYVLTGYSNVSVHDAQGRLVYHVARAYPAGWIDERTIYYTTDVGSPNEMTLRKHWTYSIGDSTPVERQYGDEWTPTGNNVVAVPGFVYWATQNALYINGTIIRNGVFLPQSPTRHPEGFVTIIEVRNGGVTAQDYVCHYLHHGAILRTIVPQHNSAHRWIPGPAQHVTYGYYGPVQLATPDGAEQDITTTPWRAEAPPMLVARKTTGDLWLWSATHYPNLDDPNQDGPSVVFGRPLNDTSRACILLHGFSAVAVEVVATDDDDFIVVGNHTDGSCQYWRISASSSRSPLLMPEKPHVVKTSPAGTLILDIWRFIVGESRFWPRTGTHPMHAHLHPGNDVTFIKFGNPTTFERWAQQGDYIYHVIDHLNNERGVAYMFSDGRWLKSNMRVGETIDCSANQYRWYRNGKWEQWQPFPYRMSLDAHRVYSDGHEEIDFTYDPGGAKDTRETFTCRSDRGWDNWQEWSQKTGALLNSSEWPRYDPDPAPVPKPIAPILWPAVRPVPITPSPEPPVPVPPSIAFPPRDESLAFLVELEQKYRDDLKRSPEQTYVDPIGRAVWMQEYLRLRVNGVSHLNAIAQVFRDIDKVTQG